MKKTIYIWTLMLAVVLPIKSFAFGDKLNFEGVLMDTSTPPVPLTTPQSVKFQILSNDGLCLLFEETQSVPVNQTDGSFAVKIGTGTRPSPAVDGGLAFNDVFRNMGGQVRSAGANCGSGYTPAIVDLRKLRVTVNGTQLTDLEISAAPMAKVAESLDGLTAPNILQVNAGQNLSQANLESIFSGGNFSNLTDLLAGGGGALTNISAPAGANSAVNRSYADTKIAGNSADATITAIGGADAGKVMSWNGTQWVAVTPSAVDSSKLPLAGGTMTGAINMGSQNILSTGHILQVPQAKHQLGAFSSAQESIFASPSDAGNIWYNSTTNELKYYNGSAPVTVGAGGGIPTLNGISGAQTFSTAATGSDFTISSAGAIHTFSIPDSGFSSRGLLTSTDWLSFNAKLGGGTGFAGDVSGVYNAIVVEKIRGVNVDPVAPSNGQVLKFNGTDWIPSVDSSGSGTVTNITTGTGLSGGPITSSGTISIAAGGVSTAEISDGTILTADLAASSVTDANIVGMSVDKLSNGAGKYSSYMPNNTECADGETLSWTAATDRWVCAANPGASAITSLTGDVTATGPGSVASTIANSAVNSAKILDGTISMIDLANDSVGSSKILDGSIAPADLASDSVTTAKILDGNVTDAKIASMSVDKLSNGGGLYFSYRPNNVPCGNGEVLIWNTALSRWECGLGPMGMFNIDGSLPMTGQFLAKSSGSPAAPEISFNSDSNTGITRPAADTISLVTNGLEQVRISAAGNVGIGTTTPSSPLSVSSDITKSVAMVINPAWNNAGTNYTGLLVDATNTASSANSFLMDLKIGGSPKFSVEKTGSIWLPNGSASNPAIVGRVQIDTGIFFPTPGEMAISNGGLESMRFDAAGNVGIGTTSPAAKLQVVGGVKIGSNGSPIQNFVRCSGAVANTTTNTVISCPGIPSGGAGWHCACSVNASGSDIWNQPIVSVKPGISSTAPTVDAVTVNYAASGTLTGSATAFCMCSN